MLPKDRDREAIVFYLPLQPPGIILILVAIANECKVFVARHIDSDNYNNTTLVSH